MLALQGVEHGALLGHAAQVPVLVMAGEDVLQEGVFAVAEGLDLQALPDALGLVVARHLAERIDHFLGARRDLALQHDLGVGRHHEVAAPGERWRQPAGLAQE